MREGRAQGQKRPARADSKHPIEVGDARFVRRSNVMHAGSQNQAVESTKGSPRLGDEPLGVVLVGHVACERDLGFELRLGQVRRGHVRAFGDESLCCGAADATCCAGDQHTLPLQATHQNGKISLIAATAVSLSPCTGTTSNVSCRSYPCCSSTRLIEVKLISPVPGSWRPGTSAMWTDATHGSASTRFSISRPPASCW